MLKSILHIFGRILANLHLIAFAGLVAGSREIAELVGFPDWQVLLALLGLFAVIFILRCMILSKYVTGLWGFRELNAFYSKDFANRFYEPWEQKRLYEERFSPNRIGREPDVSPS